MNITVSVRTIRRLAAEADADFRTVQKLVSGQRVRRGVGERIEEALRRLGVTVPPPAPPADAQSGGGHQ